MDLPDSLERIQRAQVIADPAERREELIQELVRLGHRFPLVSALYIFNTFYGLAAGFRDPNPITNGNETWSSKLNRITGHGLTLLLFQIIASMAVVLRIILNLRVDKVQLALAFMCMISFFSFLAWVVGA